MANAEAAFNVSTVVGNEVTKSVSVEPRTQLLRTTHVVLREPSSPPGTHSLVTSLVGCVCVGVGGDIGGRLGSFHWRKEGGGRKERDGHVSFAAASRDCQQLLLTFFKSHCFSG